MAETVSAWTVSNRREAGLGRVNGTVIHGNHLGRNLGFPTANVEVATGRLPDDGVYAAWVDRADGSRQRSVASLGVRPTVVEGGHRVLEVHILDVVGWIDIYGERIAVSFTHRIRSQQRFEGVDELVDRIARDCDLASSLLRV